MYSIPYNVRFLQQRSVSDFVGDSISGGTEVSIPAYSLTLFPTVRPEGSVVLNTDTDSLYVSNGSAWLSVSANGLINYGSISTPGANGAGALTVNVMGASAVTTANATTIAGNLYLYPGALAAITGPFVVAGVTIASDTVGASATALAAQNDLTAAYNQAANLPGGVTVSGDLAGMTLTPGVYKSATSLSNSGILTLNALGNANATFTFQIGSTLTFGNGASIVLVNGATAANVTFQVGSSATFGTTSNVSGIVIAQASISFAGGNTFRGRALARTGAVTFAGVASVVTLP